MHNSVIDQHVAITSNGVDVFMEKLLTKSNGSDESHGIAELLHFSYNCCLILTQ